MTGHIFWRDVFVVNIQRSRDIAMWLAVCHPRKEALNIFGREIAPAGTGMGMSRGLWFTHL